MYSSFFQGLNKTRPPTMYPSQDECGIFGMPMFPHHINFWTFLNGIFFPFNNKIWDREQLIRNHKNKIEWFLDLALIVVGGNGGEVVHMLCCAFKNIYESFYFWKI